MNIKQVTIKNFRNFEDITIEFSPGFQTIIGENNIGKSNLYWAIRLVLDKELSYNSRKLELKDFNGFKNTLEIDDHVLISIELYSEKLAEFPTFHSCKTGHNTAQITYIYAHKNQFISSAEIPDRIDLHDFQWRLFAGCDADDLESIISLATPITFRI
ncbi:AAA family ATPase [Mucilaginibacter sp. NFX135]|uniref:AAA family ATPase n=1 Tax=Mucilaginibacter sp. NFX135 TaxID=3402687 RepID=UPI003AFA7F66